MKIAYVPMCADLLHHGHINILEIASALADKVIVGLVSDKAITKYKGSPPILNINQRLRIIQSIYHVDDVMIEEYGEHGLLFIDSVKELEPDYVVHGDDWNYPKHPLFYTRNIIKTLLEVRDGQLIEPPYTEGISSTIIKEKLS